MLKRHDLRVLFSGECCLIKFGETQNNFGATSAEGHDFFGQSFPKSVKQFGLKYSETVAD